MSPIRGFRPWVWGVTARTYFAMAVKAKSTLRPVLALVSMKGSPYSCKQLLPAGWQPDGDSPGSTAPEGHPWPPTLPRLTLASFSPSSLFTTRSWVESTWYRDLGESWPGAHPPSEPGRRGQAGMLTLFPSSMSTTSCWAYSWISVSQAYWGRAETRMEAGAPCIPCPSRPYPTQCLLDSG